MTEENKKYIDSGIEIKPVYYSSDVPKTPPSEGLGEAPGTFPFTRGVQPDMYRGKLWTMRQYAGFSTAEESNKRYHFLLSQGVTGLSVAFDLPTQIGYDSDHPLAEGEVGKVGVAIDSIEDMQTLFHGIKLEDVSTSMTINATGFILLALYIALAKQQGADLKEISGTIQNDILKEYAARGTYIYPPKPSMRIITDIFEWCSKEMPKWNTISISGYHIREAGSTAVQEIAFTLSNGKAYVKAALEKGLDINVFGKRLSFFFNAHNNLFEEVAKFRAARRMWANIMKELGATDPKAMMLRFHGTKFNIWNNFPFLPTLYCLKNTCPGMVNLIRRAITTPTGHNTIKPAREPVTSKVLLRIMILSFLWYLMTFSIKLLIVAEFD